jgi:hypothetical protein
MTEAQCAVDGCDNSKRTRGYCEKHYYKYRIYGDPLGASPSRQRTCDFSDCLNKHFSSGYCEKHYRRWKRTGDPNVIRRSPNGTPAEERFWAKVQKGTQDECWFWTARTSQDGYGWFAPFTHGDMPAHRFAYQLLIGPIPDGLTLDHLCRNTLCVNPRHLEPVTNSENVRRSWEHRKRGTIILLADLYHLYTEKSIKR